MMQFKNTKNYITTEDLEMAVNAAINLEKPLLVKGEPGTGKTELAKQVAIKLGLKLFEWNIKSTTKAHQGLYEYDAVSRLRDSQLGDKKVNDIKNYIKKGTIWSAFSSQEKAVLLIDEIDKADIEFPNDLLHELDKMKFLVYETGEVVSAKKSIHSPLFFHKYQHTQKPTTFKSPPSITRHCDHCPFFCLGFVNQHSRNFICACEIRIFHNTRNQIVSKL